AEKPCDHRYIETIPKTGYRFVAPVRVMEYSPPAGTARAASNHSAQHIVGRETEHNRLRQAYDQAFQGRGGLVCVSGDAGLGKTALVDGFLQNLLDDGRAFQLARARCSESLTENEPFMPWIEGLKTLVQEPTVNEIVKKAAPTWHREI